MRTIRGDCHFSAHAMPKGARVVFSACGPRGGTRPTRDPVPFVMPLGTRAPSVPGPVHKSLSTGSGAAVPKHYEVLLSVGFWTHSTKKSRVPPAKWRDQQAPAPAR